MPPKRQVQVITKLETNEDFERTVSFGDNLCVVDAFPKWCGPVKAVIPMFKKLKIDTGNDKLLNFCTACIDDILLLEPYANTIPEPLFLFYSSGVLIDRMRGMNGPLLERKILENLALEHKIQDSQSAEDENDRLRPKAIPNYENEGYKSLSSDPKTAGLPESRLQKGQAFDDEVVGPEKEYTFGIVKPGALEHLEEIKKALADQNIQIAKELIQTLNEDEARQLYILQQDQDFYEELIQYMISGESCLLILEAEKDENSNSNIVEKFNNIVGPFDVEAAKESNPDSLRAKFGASKINNALHAADSHEAAARELAFFFPEFEKIDSTMAVISAKLLEDPAVEAQIILAIQEAGFIIADKKILNLSLEQVEKLYANQMNGELSDDEKQILSNETHVILMLSSINSVKKWQNILENNTIPQLKSQNSYSSYSSKDNNTRDRDLSLFFPDNAKSSNVSYGIIKPDKFGDREDLLQILKDNGLKITLGKEIVLEGDVVESIYQGHVSIKNRT